MSTRLKTTSGWSLAGLLAGAFCAAVTWAIVKPGPCSEPSICRGDRHGGCLPGPCEMLDYHVPLLVSIVVAGLALGALFGLLRARPDGE